MKPDVTAYFHEPTFTVSYIVADPSSKGAAIIDPVLDYDHKSGRTGTDFAERMAADIDARGLTIEWILETHAHADHLSAAPWFRERYGAKLAIGEHIADVQKIFRKVFNAEPGFATDGSQFDRLLSDGERLAIGGLEVEAMHTPGHTPACLSYRIGDAVFVGDTLFMPDYGTARADFPGGDAATLYRSIRRILALPPQTRLFLCHDYMPGGRDPAWETTIAEQRAANIHVHDGVEEAEYVRMRNERDATLEMPVLLLPSVQVNMRAGRMPPPESNGVVYLKTPVDLL
jgi:glyoxylase-like metal-dependent hydrolase (beta-lactamase superfamily II)